MVRSRLIVDDSGSIGSAIDTVKAGVRQFIESLAGTPVQIQIVRFDNTASVLGTPGVVEVLRHDDSG